MVEPTVVSRVVLLAAGTALGWLAVRTYREHSSPAGRPFSVLLALLAATAFCIGITAATGTTNKLVWLVTNLSIPVALLAFSCDYYGVRLFASRARTAAVLAPAVLGLVGGALVILGTPAKTPGMEAPLAPLVALPGGVFELATTFNRAGLYYTAGVVAVAVGLVGLNVVRYDHLDARLAVLVAFVGAWPWLGNFLVPQLTGAYGAAVSVGVLSLGYATSAGVAGLAVGPLGLLASSPAAGNVGPDRVLDSMDDAVVITDDDGAVLRLNAVARVTFGAEERTAVGRPLPALVGRPSAAFEDGTTTSLETAQGVRQFAVTRSAVTDGSGFERGTVLVLRDVTQRRTREQRLEVLNRVLRHNLRNDATSIIGRAQLISAGHGDEESAEQIIDTTRDLVGVAETARDIENMMATGGTDERAAVGGIVTTVVRELEAGYPAVDVTTALPADATAAVSPRVLENVLAQLVENAAEHNDAAEPIVVVSAEIDGDALTVAVSDNGPGIPDNERAVLAAGQEDPLQHGSGLGLWAVQWGVTQMGGRLSLSGNDPRGTTVSITVPAAETDAGGTIAETEGAVESAGSEDGELFPA